MRGEHVLKLCIFTSLNLGLLRGSVVKNLPANAGAVGDTGPLPGVGKIPWKRVWQLTPVFLPGKSHGQRSLVGYSLWGDTTERLGTYTKRTSHTDLGLFHYQKTLS